MATATGISVTCPACGADIPIPVECTLENNEGAHLGEARMICEPDMSNLWLHMWTHDEPAPEGETQ